jgi:hypothetical protein
MLIVVMNWDMFMNLITFNWEGHMQFQRMTTPHGSPVYLKYYLLFMAITCVLPYVEENYRCLRVYLQQRSELA